MNNSIADDSVKLFSVAIVILFGSVNTGTVHAELIF
jgi:hypothetical protein